MVATGFLLSCAQPESATDDSTYSCDNAELTGFSELLILAPHPDDEVLGFAGLAREFRKQGKPVRSVVVTDGDAYCSACVLWATGSTNGELCNADDLSNFATPAIDSLAEVRRIESTTASSRLDLPQPEFLGYPDTGIAFARRFSEAGDPDRTLRRSDFSACTTCGDCGGGYGSGPATSLSANTLKAELGTLIESTSPNALIATTHWLDSHGDHAGLGYFVRDQIAESGTTRSVAFAVIHAHTQNGYEQADCWYPGPATPECACVDEARADDDPGWLASLREHRERQDLPQRLPNDTDYGEPTYLCLDDLSRTSKPAAIDAFGTQLGTVGRFPGVLPESHKGLLDCSAYLRSFARRTEVFVLEEYRSR